MVEIKSIFTVTFSTNITLQLLVLRIMQQLYPFEDKCPLQIIDNPPCNIRLYQNAGIYEFVQQNVDFV